MFHAINLMVTKIWKQSQCLCYQTNSGGLDRKKCSIIIPWITTLQLKNQGTFIIYKQMQQKHKTEWEKIKLQCV